MSNLKTAITSNKGVASTSNKGVAPIDYNYIKKAMFPTGASVDDIEYCLKVSQNLGLNPILKEVFFIERMLKQQDGTKVKKIDPMVGRDGFLAIAHATGLFAGIETTYKVKTVPFMESNAWKEKTDLTAKCSVYKKGFENPFIIEVIFSEYAQYTNAGNLTVFWKDKPITMLQKVAESQALRKAFNIKGVYAPEELGALEKDVYFDDSIEKPQDTKVKSTVKSEEIIETEIEIETEETPKKTETTKVVKPTEETKTVKKSFSTSNKIPKGITLSQITIESDKFGKQEYVICDGKNAFDVKEKLKELGFFWIKENKKWGMLLNKAITSGLMDNNDSNTVDVEDEDIPF